MAIVKRRRKDGTIAYGVTVYDDALGRNVWAGTRDTLSEAKKLDATFETKPHSKVPFDEFARSWLTTRTHVRASTLRKYDYGVRVAVGHFTARPLHAITPEDVEAYVASLTDHYAPLTTSVVYTVFRMVMKSAVRYGRIERDPCADITNLPERVRRREIRPLTQDEHARLVAHMKPHHRAMVALWPLVMLRPGEMFALTSESVDGNRLRIVKQMQDGRFVELKRKASKRDIPLPSKARDIIAGIEPIPNELGLLFTTEIGTPLSSSALEWSFAQAVKDAGLEGVVPYDLRHTGATWHLYAGTPIKTLQYILGHKSATLTLDTYGHFMPSEDERAADALDKWLK